MQGILFFWILLKPHRRELIIIIIIIIITVVINPSFPSVTFNGPAALYCLLNILTTANVDCNHA